MKIGFDAKRVYHNRSGLGNYSRDIIRMLCRYFPANEYLLYNPKKGSVNFDAPGITEILPNGFLAKKLSSLWRRKWIVSQLKENNIDLFHGLSNELPAGIAAAGIPSVVTMHDLIFYRFPHWYKTADRIIHQKKAKQAVADATHIIAISRQTKDDLIHYLGVDDKKITVVYQGCHPAFKASYSNEEIESVKQQFNLPDKYLLSVGTIETRKNLLTTVKSLLLHHLPLVVVGKQTDYYHTIKKFIDENGLQQRVHFLKNVSMPQLAIIYQQAFVFCYPSLYEGFGIPIIEALYSKTPVISNKEGCFKEAGGPSSFYINATDHVAMASIIEQLQQQDVYNNCIEKGFHYVQQFNDDVIAGDIMKVYNHVLKKTNI